MGLWFNKDSFMMLVFPRKIIPLCSIYCIWCVIILEAGSPGDWSYVCGVFSLKSVSVFREKQCLQKERKKWHGTLLNFFEDFLSCHSKDVFSFHGERWPRNKTQKVKLMCLALGTATLLFWAVTCCLPQQCMWSSCCPYTVSIFALWATCVLQRAREGAIVLSVKS